MNKAELIRATADKTGISMKDADKILSAAVDTIIEELAAGGKVKGGTTGTVVAVACGAAAAGELVPVRIVEPRTAA